ncbi:DNA adenine methylase [candidate division WOR-3 bacterium]|nr:DNA adenine methylase [candidate division WOR-3 bacterium]
MGAIQQAFNLQLPHPDFKRFNVSPPLKWPGGKRWLIPKLKVLWKAHSDLRFVEPFVGSMAIALGLLSKKAI